MARKHEDIELSLSDVWPEGFVGKRAAILVTIVRLYKTHPGRLITKVDEISKELKRIANLQSNEEEQEKWRVADSSLFTLIPSMARVKWNGHIYVKNDGGYKPNVDVS